MAATSGHAGQVLEASILYFCIAFLVIAIFTMKLELLLQRSSFKVIVVFAVGAFVLGIFVHFTHGRHDSATGLLFAPLLVVSYFWVLRQLFLKWARREPINTAANWAPGLVKDRTFAFAFLFGALAIMFLTTVAAERLAWAGW
jgi:hypothetical protein